ncbi:MAG: hypothetical protein V4805_09765 [Pseudomonadota bacterium]
MLQTQTTNDELFLLFGNQNEIEDLESELLVQLGGGGYNCWTTISSQNISIWNPYGPVPGKPYGDSVVTVEEYNGTRRTSTYTYNWHA